MTVATENAPATRQDTARLIEWLDEQRQLDHERLVQLARTVDQMQTSMRDQAATLTQVETTATTRGAADVRVVDESPARLSEHLVLIERALDDHIESQSRFAQADAALRDRERRQFAELQLQVESIGRGAEAANGRTLALGEEVRHERDARPPMIQAIDELQRLYTGATSRVGAMEQIVRRLTGTQAVLEQNEDKRWSELTRVDQQLKLIDLRLTRDLSDIRKFVEESRAHAEEVLKPVEGLQRLVTQIAKEGESLLNGAVALGQSVDELADTIARVEAQARSDRAGVERLGGTLEALTRRVEASGASIWQLSERLSVLSDDASRLDGDVRTLREQADGLTRRLDKSDDDRRRLDGLGQSLDNDLRSARQEARAALDNLGNRVDLEVDALTFKAELHRKVSLEHLRRTIDELVQQMRELESEGS